MHKKKGFNPLKNLTDFTTPFVVVQGEMEYPSLTPSAARTLAQSLVNAGQTVTIYEWSKRDKVYHESEQNSKVTRSAINLQAVVALKHLEVVAKEGHDTAKKGGEVNLNHLIDACIDVFKVLDVNLRELEVAIYQLLPPEE